MSQIINVIIILKTCGTTYAVLINLPSPPPPPPPHPECLEDGPAVGSQLGVGCLVKELGEGRDGIQLVGRHLQETNGCQKDGKRGREREKERERERVTETL